MSLEKLEQRDASGPAPDAAQPRQEEGDRARQGVVEGAGPCADLDALAASLDRAIAASGYAQTSSWAVANGQPLIEALRSSRARFLRFIGIVVTARDKNTDEWMSGIADDINAELATLEPGSCVEFDKRVGGFRIVQAPTPAAAAGRPWRSGRSYL